MDSTAAEIPQANAALSVFATVTTQSFLSTHKGIWLCMDKRAPVALATRFLPWKKVANPGAVGVVAPVTVAVPLKVATYICCLASRIRDTTAARASWQAFGTLESSITLAVLNHQLHELVTHGIFNHLLQNRSEFGLLVKAMLLKLPSWNNFELDENSLEILEQFDPPAPGAPGPQVARGGGRGRGGQPGVGRGAARGAAPQAAQLVNPGPDSLRWLHDTPVFSMITMSEDTLFPLESLLKLWIVLQGSESDVVRREPGHALSVRAEVLRCSILKVLPMTNPTQVMLNYYLSGFCKQNLDFPIVYMRADQLETNIAFEEMMDTVAYLTGTALDGERAVSRRLLYSACVYPQLGLLLGELHTPEERVGQLEKLSAVVCPGRHDQTLHLRLSELERFLADRVPLITVGRNRGESGAALVDMVLLDNASMTAGSASLSGASGPRDDMDFDSSFGTSGFISNKALIQCLQQPKFVEAANLIKTKDVGTAQGRLDILEIATTAEVLIFQLIMGRPESSLRHRSDVLSDVAVSMAEAPQHFGSRQACGEDGVLHPLAQNFHASMPQIKLLTRGKISKMQAVNLPDGALAVLNLTAATPYESVPEGQLYIVDSALEAGGTFLHQAVVAFYGKPAAHSSTGYTMKTLYEKQRSVLHWVMFQGDVVRKELMPQIKIIFEKALEDVDAELYLLYNAPQPHLVFFQHVLPFGGTYDRAIDQLKEAVLPILTLQRAVPGLLAFSSRRSLPGVSLAAGGSHESQGGGDEKPSRKQEKEERAAKRKLEEEKKKGKQEKKGATAALPGSKKEMCSWEEGCSEPQMVFGVDVFKVGEYSTHLKLKPDQVQSLCWPVLCSRQERKAALAFCPCPKKKGHQGPNDTAHRRPSGFDLDTFLKDFATKRTYTGKKPKKE